MTEQPESEFVATEADEPFGPNSDNMSEPTVTVDTDKKNSNKSGRKSQTKTNLGNNKKRGSGVRQLTKKDHAKIVDMYNSLAFGLMPFKADVAQAVVNNAEQCADAWVELATENDNVRRTLLAMLEGSAWSKLLMAHMPIALAAIPHDMLPMPLQGMFGNVGTPPDDLSGLNGDSQ